MYISCPHLSLVHYNLLRPIRSLPCIPHPYLVHYPSFILLAPYLLCLTPPFLTASLFLVLSPDTHPTLTIRYTLHSTTFHVPPPPSLTILPPSLLDTQPIYTSSFPTLPLFQALPLQYVSCAYLILVHYHFLRSISSLASLSHHSLPHCTYLPRLTP